MEKNLHSAEMQSYIKNIRKEKDEFVQSKFTLRQNTRESEKDYRYFDRKINK